MSALVTYRARIGRGLAITYTPPVTCLPWVGICGCGTRISSFSHRSVLERVCLHLKYDHNGGAK